MSTIAGSKDSHKEWPKAGLIIGFVLALVIVTHGGVIPLLAGALGMVLSVLFTMALIVLIGGWIEQMGRQHHKAIGRGIAKGGTRAAKVTARGTARHSGRLGRWLHRRAGERWSRGEHRPLMFRRHETVTETKKEEVTTRRLDGKPETEADKRFFDLREKGYTGPINQDGYAVPELVTDEKGNEMAVQPLTNYNDTRPVNPDRRNGRQRIEGGNGNVPAGWAAVADRARDAEWENDGELLTWMAEEATGMAAYAEALIQAYETGVNTVGLDPTAMAALHDVADAAAEAAEQMAAARKKFAEHYSEVRDFAANGGLLPYNGRWMTGEGEA